MKKHTFRLLLGLFLVNASQICADEEGCECKPCPTFEVKLDYLYWRPTADGFFVCIDNPFSGLQKASNPVRNFGNVHSSENVKYLNFQYDSGFRLGIGYLLNNCACGGEAFHLEWTHYTSSASKKLHPIKSYLLPFTATQCSDPVAVLSGSKFVFPPPPPLLIIVAGGAIPVRDIRSHWDLQLDLVDLGGHLRVSPDCGFTFLHPYLDLRYLDLEQSLALEVLGSVNLDYINVSPVSSLQVFPFSDFSGREQYTMRYQGLGPQLGIGVDFPLLCGFGVYADGALSFLYGRHSATACCSAERFNGEEEEYNTEVGAFSDKLHGDKNCLRTAAKAEIGIMWDSALSLGCVECNFKLGWELLFFFNQSLFLTNSSANDAFYFMTVPYSQEDSDLSIQGLTLSLTGRF